MDSIPEFVMRTGVIAPFSPGNARRDIRAAHVQSITNLPVGQQAGMAGYFGQDEMEGFGNFGAFTPKRAVYGGAGGAVAGGLLGAMTARSGERLRGAGFGALAGVGAGLLALFLADKFA